MALPSIPPYIVPIETDYPTNRVAWRPHPARAVLLIHDMQRYFVDAFESKAEPLTSVLANIQLLREQAETAGIPVVYSAQPPSQSPRDRRLLTDFWGPGLGDDGGDAIVSELAPSGTDTVVTKWRYSAFVRTDLRERMSAWGRDQLIITGLYAHIGCLMTAADAFMHDIQPFLVADAVADFSVDYHRQALTYAAERCAVVAPTRTVTHDLAQGAELSAVR
ncbi:hypothetical protein GCM10022198_16730 [Klugiella xanthotipulae]|uniref:Bifunctional isochorismate lyase/aryl carrier protein n=1 Tax=Klugiella xanthotipulae TaxID=244735 RepID=A0A543HHB4_9MICO|nr:isochorismatase family protein [Klugiella xanthotipulae]TQM57710.1 bifunctional isochorismate lyase/aryl carrier protein [Klugiella xanthotipulae]